MFQKTLLGMWATCALLVPQIATAASGDVVLCANGNATLHGNWTRVADQTAANGQLVASSDQGWSNSGGPLASPADYVDFTFNAPSATPYRIWLRMRAAANSTYNDSVFAQFSDVVGLSGASFYGIGTTNGIIVNLANNAAGDSLSGWGWQGGAYWLGQATTVVFATSGSHTLRIQTREDGVSIDQIVLSPMRYLATAPGPLGNDATIVPSPTGLPAPWSAGDVGSVGRPGWASFADDLFDLNGAGADISGTADAFHFVSRSVNGAAQIVARVVSLQNVNSFAKAGVMFRDTTAADSAHVVLGVRPNGSIEFMSRGAAGEVTAYLGGGTQPVPAWLRLTRSGNVFTGESSVDGVAWTVVGSTGLVLAVDASAGLVVSSHTVAQLAQATFDHVAVVVSPSMPSLPAPFDTSIGIGLDSLLTWSAAGAVSYDVSFGTVNPPAPMATGMPVAAYAPATMTNGVTYFWRVGARNAAGTTLGPVWSFTAVTTAAQPPTGAPSAYNAISDRNPYVKPAVPSLGPAGFVFADPTFGSGMVRVTDGQTRPDRVNRSFRVPSNAHLAAWNADSTAFYVMSNDGTSIPYEFNAATMTASRMQASASGDGGLTLAFYVEPQFSRLKSNIIYGVSSGGNNRTISQFDFKTGAYSVVLNLDTIAGGLAGTYVGGLISGGTSTEKLVTFFGGGAQDSHFYALWAPIDNLAGRKLLNTLASTINGAPTSTVLNFRLHSTMVDKSGRFVFLYPTWVDMAAPRYASQVYVWDTSTDVITAITSGGHDGGPAMRPYGHDAAGYETWVNQDCCTSSTWDAGQWQFRRLTSLAQISDLIAPVQAVKEIYMADHTTWNNAQPDVLVPVISSTYRHGDNTAPWRAWDDEIIAIETANGGGGNVWRFAHHRSNVTSDSNPATTYFWYQPIANVSPDGKWVVFTSNWEKTLGIDSAEGTFRQDVFLVQLSPSADATSVERVGRKHRQLSHETPIFHFKR
jgi:hypothetical protein